MRKRRVVGRMYGMKQNEKEWASLVGLGQRHKPQHPNNVKMSLWGLLAPSRVVLFKKAGRFLQQIKEVKIKTDVEDFALKCSVGFILNLETCMHQ